MQLVGKIAGFLGAGLLGSTALAQAAPLTTTSGAMEKLIETTPAAAAVIVVVYILIRHIKDINAASAAKDIRVEGVLDRNTTAINGLTVILERHGIDTTKDQH